MKETIKINSDFITLGQFLKLIGEIGNGGHAKFFLEENDIYVNNILEKRRGKKIHKNDIVTINNKEVTVI